MCTYTLTLPLCPHCQQIHSPTGPATLHPCPKKIAAGGGGGGGPCVATPSDDTRYDYVACPECEAALTAANADVVMDSVEGDGQDKDKERGGGEGEDGDSKEGGGGVWELVAGTERWKIGE